MSRIVEIEGPAAERVEIEVTLTGNVTVKVNGGSVLIVGRAKIVSIDIPSQSVVIEQKEKPRRLTEKEKRNEQWEMEQLMPRTEQDEE